MSRIPAHRAQRAAQRAAPEAGSLYATGEFDRRLARRRRSQSRLLWVSGSGVVLATVALLILLGSILWMGWSGFQQVQIGLPLELSGEELRPESGESPRQAIRDANLRGLPDRALAGVLGRPEGRQEERAMGELVSTAAPAEIRRALLANPEWLGGARTIWVPADDAVGQIVKGFAPRDVPEADRLVNDAQLAWIDRLRDEGLLRTAFNWDFLSGTTSREPEIVGVKAAVISSVLMLAVTFAVAIPLGVAAAVYLEEFAPRNRIMEAIDLNIRNLAAVPSIVMGLLGLALFIRFAELPRSSILVGGLTLALMTLPIIIIAARAAIAAVPDSLRTAALQLGASKMQVTGRVVLPNALPGILTGTIIGLAQALGETAPLLMIGMVAFIPDVPSDLTDPAAPLPVQIYLWSTSPETAFMEKTAAAILVLLAMMIVLNALAIYLRNRLQRRW
jgi:phosphate transport system permease protein